MPMEPQRPAGMDVVYKTLTETKDAIELFLSSGGSFAITKLQAMVPGLRILSPQRIAVLLSQLVEEGRLLRTEKEGKTS